MKKWMMYRQLHFEIVSRGISHEKQTKFLLLWTTQPRILLWKKNVEGKIVANSKLVGGIGTKSLINLQFENIDKKMVKNSIKIIFWVKK